VRIADDPGAFAAAVDAAMAELHTGDARRSACDSVLARTSWDNTWTRMTRLIDDALRQKRHVKRHDASPLR
jgi:UDP-galactopyranose mutase